MTHFVNPKPLGGDLVTGTGRSDGRGADYTFDCTGNTDVMRQALSGESIRSVVVF